MLLEVIGFFKLGLAAEVAKELTFIV